MNPQTDSESEPLAKPGHEREAIRNELPENIHVLTWVGDEEMVALVKREKPPSTEYPSNGERIVLVEWPMMVDYGLSVAVGQLSGWELTDEVLETHESRSDAINAAAELLEAE